MTDITYIRTGEGFAYLAFVIDLYSRRVTAEPANHRRFLQALLMAVWRRAEEKGADLPGPGRAVHQHGLGLLPEVPQSVSLDEPTRQLP